MPGVDTSYLVADMLSEEQARRTWLFSDPHFDHANIIRYCERPFKDVEEMNETLLRNYRELVGPDDGVYFLGDMAFGRNSSCYCNCHSHFD